MDTGIDQAVCKQLLLIVVIETRQCAADQFGVGCGVKRGLQAALNQNFNAITDPASGAGQIRSRQSEFR